RTRVTEKVAAVQDANLPAENQAAELPSASPHCPFRTATDWQVPAELPDLRRAGIIALDIETKDEGLIANPRSGGPFGHGYICGVSVAYRAGGEIPAHYFPLRHPDSQNFDPGRVFAWLKDLAASDVRIVTQNGLYDWGWLRTEAGIKMPPSERLEE